MLDARGISFSYGAHQVLNGIDLEVKSGEVVGLLGPNGTGKTTLMGVLTGDLEPATGQVMIAGKNIGDYKRRELAQVRSVMPQISDFPFSYLARDIVAMGRACWGTSPAEDDAMIDLALERAEVVELADRDITQLSGGERARVTFARVLAQQGTLMFLDEPTAALDISHQERTMAHCVEESRNGAAVVAVLHDIQLAAAYCDRIVLLDQGRVAATGTPPEVLTSELLTQVYNWPIRVHRFDDGTLAILPARSHIDDER